MYFYNKYFLYIDNNFYVPEKDIIEVIWLCKLRHSYHTKFIFKYKNREFPMFLSNSDVQKNFILIGN